MSTPTSKKANYVLRSTPDFCRIWFVCKNHLIFTREGHGRELPTESNQPSIPDDSDIALYSPLPKSAGASTSWSPISHPGFSPTNTMTQNMFEKVYAQLQQAHKESTEATLKMHRELKLREKAEKETAEAIQKAQKAETDVYKLEGEYTDAMIRLEKALDELCDANAQIASFESETEKWNLKVEEMETKLESSRTTQKKYKKLNNSLQKKLNDAIHLREGSTNHIAREHSDPDVQIFSSEYSLVDLDQATNCFDPSLKIGKGRYGDVYRGVLNHTDVAIKILKPTHLQGPSEIKKEVEVLSKLRHPNLVTLIGTCTKSQGLIYEYLPNGSLQDRLNCKDDTPPLPWQTRIQIATDLCSLLNFLHSRNPNSIIHADINAKNVLLDANFSCKLSGFGSCHVISNGELSRVTGKRQVSPEIDVYSFGILLLCLLTAEPSIGIVKKMKYALENDDLRNILDDSAGQWPFVRATQLAHLALRCCHLGSDDRPDLATEVWMVLKPTKDPSLSLPNPIRIVHEDRIPSYFICPILQEIMQDPHFAADGFTYEASAIQTWFEGGHETSPMTNLRLADCHLTPNRTLHSAIQEWRQKYQCVQSLAHLLL